jgi:hypothetical protein
LAEAIRALIEEHPYVSDYSPDVWEFIIEFEEGLQAMAEFLAGYGLALAELTREDAERDEMLMRIWNTEKERLDMVEVTRFWYDDAEKKWVVEHVLEESRLWP